MKKKSTIGILFQFAAQCRQKMIFSTVFSIVGVLSGLLPFFAIAAILSGLFSGTADVKFIVTWVAIAAAGETLKFLMTTYSSVKAHECAFSIMENIRKSLTDKMLSVPLGIMVETPTGQLKALAVDTVEKMEKPLAHMLPEIAGNFFSPLCVLILLFSLDWRMGLASLFTIPIGLLCYMGMMKDYRSKSKRYMESSAAMDNALVEYVNGIKVIKAFNQSATSYRKYKHAINYYHDTTLEWWRSTWLYSALGFTIIPAILIGSLPVGAYLFQAREIEFSIFITCVILSVGISGPIMQIGGFVDNFAVVDASMNQINAFLEIEELKRPGDEAKKTLNGEGFEFENVSFGYSEKEILHNVSFTPVRGGMTAIVGPSGSGKSTMAKLMAGFWDVNKGKITYGGVDVRELPFSQLTEEISFVSQDNFLFNVSIKENIRMGNQDASDEQIYEVAKLTNCHEFIMNLEQGYDTLAGDAGGRLSGGERQRITIARAMLKRAQTVILDEATAYTDPENETQIQQAIGKMVHGKTLIVVAHRLSSIKNAEQIIVMKDGRISDCGTHEELLKRSDLYKKMWLRHISIKDNAEKEEMASDTNFLACV